MPDTRKAFYVQISDPTGTTPLGYWDDAPIPQLRLGSGGTQAWQFPLPRAYGAMDEPGEPGSGGTLAWGNRVDVYVSDAASQLQPIRSSILGAVVLGSWTLGALQGLGRLVWRGSIENWDVNPEGGVTVNVVDLDRLLDGSPMPGQNVYSGDPLQVAKSIVQAFLPGLRWDSNNPNTSGQTVTNLTFTNVTVGSALAQLRDLCGTNWKLLVTAYSTVRLFQPATSGAPTHTLMVGYHCIGALLQKSGIARRKRVIVTYAQGHTAEARSLDYNPLDPRAEFVNADSVTDAGDAARLAGYYLAAKDTITLNGRCTVLDERYDLESIQPGDTVRLQTERPNTSPRSSILGAVVLGSWILGSGDGYMGYGNVNLVVAGITYTLYTAQLDLSEPQLRFIDMASALQKQFAQLRSKVG